MWDLEARLAEEKASVEAHARDLQIKLNEERDNLEQAREAKIAAEDKRDAVTLKISSALKFLPAQFPDIKTLWIGPGGLLCLTNPTGKDDQPTKASIRTAIAALRDAYVTACTDREGLRTRLRDTTALLQEKIRVEEEVANQWKLSEWIVARGESDDVPEVLRWSGQVKNRNLTKKETVKVSKYIFARRLAEPDVDVWGHLLLYAAANYGAKARRARHFSGSCNPPCARLPRSTKRKFRCPQDDDCKTHMMYWNFLHFAWC